MPKFSRGALILGLIFVVVLVGVIVHIGEGRDLLLLVRHAQPAWLLLALLLQAGTYCCNVFMWQPALRRSGFEIPFRFLLRISVAKLFIDQAAPSAGVSGSVFTMNSLSRRGVSHATAVGALFVGLAGYYVAYAVLFGAAIAYIAHYASVNHFIVGLALLFGVVVLIFAAILILLWSGVLMEKIPERMKRWKFLKPWLEALHEVPHQILNEWKLLAESSLAALGIFILDALTLWAILHSLGVSFALGRSLASFMVASVAGTIGFIPGGLGIFEGSSTGMLAFLGLPIETAVAATLILRGLTYWLPMLPGILIARQELKPQPPANPGT